MSTAVATGFVPSAYQQDIFTWIEHGTGDAVVNAVAGSGKSTTLVEGAKRVQGSVLFLAFNKSIVTELERKLIGTGVEAKTVNGLGHGALMGQLGKVRLDATKYRNVIDALVKGRQHPDLGKYVKNLAQLVSFAQSSLTDVTDQEAVYELAAHYGVELESESLRDLRRVLAEGERLARDAKLISFDDQIWLPAMWRLAPTRKYDFVMVDECQDLNPTQYEIISHLAAGHRSLFFVGDEEPEVWTCTHIPSEAPEPAVHVKPSLGWPAALTAALGKIPEVRVPSNFTARVLDAIELEAAREARTRGWTLNWRVLLPRMAVAAAVLVFAGVSVQHYEASSHRAELAKNLMVVASAQSPGVDALENLDAIQRMSQSGHADGELLAALQ